MSRKKTEPDRFVGLDVHKHYLIAAAVDADRNEVMSPRRVPLARLDPWVRKTLTSQDAVVLEMVPSASATHMPKGDCWKSLSRKAWDSASWRLLSLMRLCRR